MKYQRLALLGWTLLLPGCRKPTPSADVQPANNEEAIVTVTCGSVLSHEYDYGRLSAAQIPLGSVFVLSTTGFNKGRVSPSIGRFAISTDPPSPQTPGSTDSLVLLNSIDISLDASLSKYEAQIKAAAQRDARLVAFNTKRQTFENAVDSLNNDASPVVRQIRDLTSGLAAATNRVLLVTTVFYMDSVRVGVKDGKDGSADASLGVFGKYNVTAKYSCSELASFTGGSVPRSFKVGEVTRTPSGNLTIAAFDGDLGKVDFSAASQAGNR